MQQQNKVQYTLANAELLSKTIMTTGAIKNISFVLVVLATLLLISDVVHFIMVSKTEKGLWDFLPARFITIVFICYQILFLTSYILFVLSKKVKSKFDFISNILFLFNGLVIVFILVIYLTELSQNL
jgi:hypothetical protein